MVRAFRSIVTLVQFRNMSGFSCARNVRCCFRWVPSELNNSDVPSTLDSKAGSHILNTYATFASNVCGLNTSMLMGPRWRRELTDPVVLQKFTQHRRLRVLGRRSPFSEVTPMLRKQTLDSLTIFVKVDAPASTQCHTGGGNPEQRRRRTHIWATTGRASSDNDTRLQAEPLLGRTLSGFTGRFEPAGTA